MIYQQPTPSPTIAKPKMLKPKLPGFSLSPKPKIGIQPVTPTQQPMMQQPLYNPSIRFDTMQRFLQPRTQPITTMPVRPLY